MINHIRVQETDFSPGDEYARLTKDNSVDGAVVSFAGRVRDVSNSLEELRLEHYPGMTEQALTDIVEQARKRWQLGNVSVIHRVGKLAPGDNIVWVGVTSRHRRNAFAACEFIMDFLKTQAPFWKKETTSQGSESWVDARDSDVEASNRWN